MLYYEFVQLTVFANLIFPQKKSRFRGVKKKQTKTQNQKIYESHENMKVRFIIHFFNLFSIELKDNPTFIHCSKSTQMSYLNEIQRYLDKSHPENYTNITCVLSTMGRLITYPIIRSNFLKHFSHLESVFCANLVLMQHLL